MGAKFIIYWCLWIVAFSANAAIPKDLLRPIKDLGAKNILKKTVIEATDLASVRNLRIDNAQVSKVEGFEIFENLKYLSLSGNFITNIVPLTHLSQLKTLNLSKNQIVTPSGINLLERLESLDLSYNQLKYAFCCSFSVLHYLKLNHNKIEQLIFIKDFNKLLEDVDVSNNPLKSITIKAPLPYLKKLNANETFLTQLDDFAYFQALEELNVKNCIHLQSIAILFQLMGDHWECKLKRLKKLSVSEEFLDKNSKDILMDIRKNNKLIIQ